MLGIGIRSALAGEFFSISPQSSETNCKKILGKNLPYYICTASASIDLTSLQLSWMFIPEDVYTVDVLIMAESSV